MTFVSSQVDVRLGPIALLAATYFKHSILKGRDLARF